MRKRFRLLVAGVVVAVVAAGAVIAGPVLNAGAATDAPVPVTPFSGFDPGLTRAPYVTDLTQGSADVVWGTLPSSDHGTLKWGPSGSCTLHTAPVSATQEFTVGTNEDQSTVTLTGLAANTAYCYRVYSPTGTDLLGSSQSFTTLAAVGSSTPVTFDVVGDLGETYYTDSGGQFPNAPANFNPDQAAIDALIGQSKAQFVVTAGDVAYNDGSVVNYGDLQPQNQGSRMSDIFGPSYWPETGGLPTFGNVGNHGQNATSLEVWPESATAAASGGTYAYQSFPPVDGITGGNAPNAWYAISAGNTRIYVLDAAWADGNVGSAPGGEYQVDHDEHWAPSSPEYQWLQSDLSNPAYAGMTKMAVFHFPLRSANSTQSSDTYLQNSSANPDGASSSLEALLASSGVRLVFNGHAHTYQRIVPSQTGQITNYVTGGGGGVLEPVGNCSSVGGSVYALGWSPTTNSGSSCGTSAPGSAADVYNFLKVTVSGSSITVDPENAAGNVFDPQTYGPPTTTGPSTPGSVTALASSSNSIQVDWAPSTEKAPGTIHDYLVYRNASQTPIATVTGTTSFLDTSVAPGTKYAYQIVAVDNSNLQSSPGVSNTVATPSPPGNVTAAATSGTSVRLNWTASSETGGTIQSYQISRNGTVINPDNPVPASSTSYTDTTAQPGTTYTYSVTALDHVGGQSTPATSNQVTTPGQAPGGLPFTGGCMSQLPAGSVVGSAALPDGTGYYEVDSAGDVAAFGGAACSGAMTGTPLNKPIVGMAVDPATGGYWLVATDGGIFSFNAPFFGSTGAIRLNKPIVGMASTPSGGGYWMVASDGGVFTFGNNQFYGSTGNLVLNKPVVGMAADPATGGYWLVATDGGIFSFNAPFYGSTGAIRLNQPVVGMAAASDGSGYRLIASDGGVFCFNEPFYGSTGSIRLNRPMIAGLNDNATGGYWLTASDGGVFSFNAPFLGSAA